MAFNLGDAVVSITGQVAPGLNKALGDADAAVRRGMGNILDLARKAGAAMTAASGAIAGALTLSVRAASDLDRAMTESLSIVSGVSDQMRERMRALAMQLSGESRFSAAQLAQAYYFLASAGLNAEQSMQALPVVMRFATAGAFDLETATELLADAQTALGLRSADAAKNMENMQRVSDVLVDAANRSNASVQQFAEALTSGAAASMRMLNISIEDGVAALAAFADQGIKGSEAGTAFGIVLRDLQTKFIEAKQKGDQSTNMFKRLGIEVFDASGRFAGLSTVIAQLERALAGMSDEQKKATLAALGFADRSVQFTQSLLGMSQSIKAYEQAFREAGNATEIVSQLQMAAFSNQMAALRNRITNVAIELGAQLMPLLQRLANEVIIPALESLTAFVREHENLALQLAKIGIALGVAGPVLIGFSMLRSAITTAQLAMAALSPPMLAVVGTLTGLAALLETFRNETGFDNFITRALDRVESLRRALDWLADKLVALIERISDALRWIGMLEARPALGAGALGRNLDFRLSDQAPGFSVPPVSAMIQSVTINTTAPLDGAAARRFAQTLAVELRRARGR